MFLMILGSCILWIGGASRLHADCINLSDIPLDTLEQAAPGIVMFLIDDSGSMDWSMMTRENDGTFQGYEYVFSNPGDDNYTSGSYDDNQQDSDSDRMKWMSQWSGYNHMYYNPDSTYTPWPRWSALPGTDPPNWSEAPNADPDNPRSNPIHSAHTLNMSATFHDFSGGTSLDINAPGVVVVDNSDTVTGGEIIVDNKDPEYSEHGSWHESGASNEYNGSSRYTTNSGDYATWRPDLPAAGTYKVYIWYTYWSTRDTNAKYIVHHAGVNDVFRINQQVNAGQWVELGDFNFDAGTSGYIRVKRDSHSTGSSTSADAVRLVPQSGGTTPDILFESTGPWAPYSASGQYGSDYLYTPSVDTYTATWTANNLDPGDSYDVYARWVATSSRSTSVEYDIVHDGGTAVVHVNQRQNNGTWQLLSSGLSFSSGSGVVTLSHHVDSTSWDKACADAVAFVPSGSVSAVKIVRAHYYVRNANGTFLVNLDGGIKYYRVDYTGTDPAHALQSSDLHDMTEAEALAAGIVTGRTYLEERQNFANWYSFYRRRELTAKNAIAKVITTMKGVYIGMISIHHRITQRALPVHVVVDGTAYDETDSLLNTLYSLDSSGGTPLRLGLKDVGRYYMGDYLRPGTLPQFTNSASFPYFIADKGGSCEQSFCIAMTDGFWNGSSPSIGNEDGNNDTDFDGGKFADSYSDTLADVAMNYYEHDLNPDLENDVPINDVDSANHQHMVTYSLSFGVEGTIHRDDFPDCPTGDCPTWPNPGSGDPQKIDDLYHAAVNGRGMYVNAGSPEELVDALEALKQDIEKRIGSAASLATNTIQRQFGSRIYQGIYNTQNWSGEVSAMPVDVNTGEIGQPLWTASSQLDAVDFTNRVILTYNGSSGIPFEYDNLSETQKAMLDPDPAVARNLVNYLRGDTSLGGSFRTRDSRIGDVVHSAPVYFSYGNAGMVYIGANDGMLHAFDAGDGHEVFAYVPNLVFDHLSELADTGYTHRFYVDNTPYVTQAGAKKLLVCGLRKGGKGYFCLDVTNPFGMAEADAADVVKWEYSADGDDDLGYTYSRAYIVDTEAAGWVVIFGNGYDSVNQEAVLYVLDADTGALVKKFHTGVSGCNGLSTPTVIDVEFDGKVDYAYAGDLRGNLWKFDLTGDSVVDWKVSYSDGTNPKPLFTAKNADGAEQPITLSPEVMGSCAAGGNGYMVVFGTGRYVSTGDLADPTVQSLYGVWDWEDMWEDQEGKSVAQKLYLGSFTTDRHLSNLEGNQDLSETVQNLTLLQQTVEYSTGDWLVMSDNNIYYYDHVTDTGSHVGWYFDLPQSGERSIRDPILRSGVAVIVSSIPSDSPCATGGSSVIYQVEACTGGRTEEPQFDYNGDNKIDQNDLINTGNGNLPPTGKKVDAMLFPPPIDLKGLLYMPDANGSIHIVRVPKNPPGMSYWRIIE